jgi:hypothetical protein
MTTSGIGVIIGMTGLILLLIVLLKDPYWKRGDKS